MESGGFLSSSCRGLSRSVEVCRVAVELCRAILSSSCRVSCRVPASRVVEAPQAAGRSAQGGLNMRNSSSDSSLDAKYSFTTHQHVRRNLKHQFTTNAADIEKVVPEVLSAQSISPLRTCSISGTPHSLLLAGQLNATATSKTSNGCLLKLIKPETTGRGAIIALRGEAVRCRPQLVDTRAVP